MGEPFAVRLARENVQHYTEQSDAVMRQHYEALDCLDCEAFLQLGIDAFHSLVWTDEAMRKGVQAGSVQYTDELTEAFRCMFTSWLKPCGFAESWIALQEQRGYRLTNLAEFRRCCEEARAVVESLEETALPDAMAGLRDRALAEHRDGKTAEFLEEN